MRTLRSNSFLWMMLLYLAVGGVLLLIFRKGELLLELNSRYSENGGEIFAWITRLGEEHLAVAVVILLLVFHSYRAAIFTASATIANSLLTAFFKQVVFSNMDRPATIFKDLELQFTEGVRMHHHFSFPSGHTSEAFALFSALAFIFHKNKTAGIVFFSLATLAGISRMYLVQHFMMDIYAGAFLGTIVSILFYHLYYERMKQGNKLDGRLIGGRGTS